jgi:peptidyl-prolyl cis-trans isomerase SurA
MQINKPTRSKPGIVSILLLAVLFCVTSRAYPADINGIVAIVEDDAILASELNAQVRSIQNKLQSSGTPLPPEAVMQRQVLERMIVNKLQLQQAGRAGVHVDDSMLQRSVAQLAKQNNMSTAEFRQAVISGGLEYSEFLTEIRNEMLINQLRNRVVTSRIKVSDREVKHFINTQAEGGIGGNVRYRLGHILIGTPEAASATQIHQARERAKSVVQKLEQGEDFGEVAVSNSGGTQGLSGGDLGWRQLGAIPTIFVDYVTSMQVDDVRGPIQSASGFHIIKLLELEGKGKHVVTQTKVQHILLKTSDLFSDEDAQQKLQSLRQRMEDGDDFSTLAKAHSDDKASALKGGELGWVSPGILVPAFEEAMTNLLPGEISQPVQTQFGWHLIQVLDRADKDNTKKYREEQARQQLRKKKIEEETELWLRRLRNEAFVEIRLRQG